MSIEAQPNTTANDDNVIINVSHSSPPSKNRRRRRKNNKNRNKNQTNRQMKTTNKTNQQTKLYSHKSLKKKKSTPWQKTNTASKFENIMNEQTTKQSNSYYNNYDQALTANEADLLEQQMILEAIAASNKLQKEQKETNNATKSTDIEHKNDIYVGDDDEKHENVKNTQNKKNKTPETDINDKKLVTNEIDNYAQTMNDELLAVHLQKVEENELQRQQKLSEIYDGKYAKVTSSNVHASAIPKSALQFYYDNNAISKEEESVIEDNNCEVLESETETEVISKHDARMWSERHMNRLNEYEMGGDLNTNLNIGNQCYNSFRNQLDRKGFINYHNYQLQLKDDEKR